MAEGMAEETENRADNYQSLVVICSLEHDQNFPEARKPL